MIGAVYRRSGSHHGRLRATPLLGHAVHHGLYTLACGPSVSCGGGRRLSHGDDDVIINKLRHRYATTAGDNGVSQAARHATRPALPGRSSTAGCAPLETRRIKKYPYDYVIRFLYCARTLE